MLYWTRDFSEQFISEHFFLYLAKGTIHGYDGHKDYKLQSGECCLVRKNYLACYNKEKENDEFEKVVIIFDELFLKKSKTNIRFQTLLLNLKMCL